MAQDNGVDNSSDTTRQGLDQPSHSARASKRAPVVRASSPAGQTSAVGAAQPKVWEIILLAFVAVVFTASWLGLYGFLSAAVWPANFAVTRRWTIPVGVLLFSGVVGLAQRYLRAPTVIHGGAVDAFKGGERPDYTVFPGALVTSYASLLSGASVGPEGSLGVLVQQITAWTGEKVKIAQDSALGVRVAALASAYNGIIGNALFTGVFATELGVGAENALLYLGWNLLAGVIGYTFFILLKLPIFAQYIPFTPISQMTLPYVLDAVLLGVVGTAVALFVGLAFRVCGTVIERAFHERVIWRALGAGVIIAIVGLFVPDVLFAGEKQIFPMIQNPAAYGVLGLLGLGTLKLLMLAVSFKSGFLGGPTFPILFACTMFGLALSLLFPGVPASVFVLCIEVAAFTLALRAPLTSILLVAVIGTADAYMIALLVVSSVVALMVGGAVQRYVAQRAAASQTEQPASRSAIA